MASQESRPLLCTLWQANPNADLSLFDQTLIVFFDILRTGFRTRYCITSVSYTHLDVYKRQAQYSVLTKRVWGYGIIRKTIKVFCRQRIYPILSESERTFYFSNDCTWTSVPDSFMITLEIGNYFLTEAIRSALMWNYAISNVMLPAVFILWRGVAINLVVGCKAFETLYRANNTTFTNTLIKWHFILSYYTNNLKSFDDCFSCYTFSDKKSQIAKHV